MFQRSHKPDHTSCVCIVTSYSVTAAVVKKFTVENAISNPLVVFSAEEKIFSHQDSNLEDDTVRSLKRVLESARSFHGNFDSIVCVMGEPWIRTFSRVVRVAKNEPFSVTQKMIDELMARDERLFGQDVMRDEIGQGDMGIVGISKPRILLNGYSSNEFAGKRVKELAVSYLISIAAGNSVDLFFSAFVDVFHREDIMFKSLDHAMFRLAPEKEYLLLSIGGRTSSLSIVHPNQAMHSVIIPSGVLDMEKNIVQRFQIPKALIPSFMNFGNDPIRDVDSHFSKTLEGALQEFNSHLVYSTDELSRRVQPMPGTLVVISPAPWIKSVADNLSLNGESEEIIVIDGQIELPDVTYAHDAQIQNPLTSLAILEALS